MYKTSLLVALFSVTSALAGCPTTVYRKVPQGQLPDSCLQGEFVCAWDVYGASGPGYYSCNNGKWEVGACGWPQQCHDYPTEFDRNCFCW